MWLLVCIQVLRLCRVPHPVPSTLGPVCDCFIKIKLTYPGLNLQHLVEQCLADSSCSINNNSKYLHRAPHLPDTILHIVQILTHLSFITTWAEVLFVVLYRRGKWRPERFRHMLKVTQLLSGRPGIWTQAAGCRALALNYEAVLVV